MESKRQDAVNAVFNEYGVSGILELVSRTTKSWEIGYHLTDVIDNIDDDMKQVDQEGDTDSDCLMIDRNKDGNFVTNLISGLIAYCFFPKKPAINYEVILTDQISLF